MLTCPSLSESRPHHIQAVSNMQAALRQGVRSTLAALLEAPEASLEVAVDARNTSGSSLTTTSGGAGPVLDLVASHSIFVVVSPPVCSLDHLESCYVEFREGGSYGMIASSLTPRGCNASRPATFEQPVMEH